jgi:dTDP-L-rhamnose 4-epimerase
VLGKEVEPEVPGKFRAGDIRHCFADVTLARETLGFEPQVPLEQGLGELAASLEGQVAADRSDEAAAELAERGLTR